MHFLSELDGLLAKRKQELPADSYTSSLFQAGIDRILRKIGEEAAEVIVAAKNQQSVDIVNESADLLFHLMLVLHATGHSLEDVATVLKTRHRE